jgi:hypothetical protein
VYFELRSQKETHIAYGMASCMLNTEQDVVCTRIYDNNSEAPVGTYPHNESQETL